ncbi:MAG: hypothetical protein IPL10_02015 [Bacteroidetes bacterium]|nr:hypothetical protein [Bacteroidota bacterium]
MKKTIIDKYIITLTTCLICCNLIAQTNKTVTPIKKECSFNSSKLIGKWVDFYPLTKVTSLDSIEQILKASADTKMFNIELMEDFNLNFTKDSSLVAFGTTVKYYIDNANCNLVTVTNPKTQKTRLQKIYVLNDKFLVLQNCTNECYTMFYIKQ